MKYIIAMLVFMSTLLVENKAQEYLPESRLEIAGKISHYPELGLYFVKDGVNATFTVGAQFMTSLDNFEPELFLIGRFDFVMRHDNPRILVSMPWLNLRWYDKKYNTPISGRVEWLGGQWKWGIDLTIYKNQTIPSIYFRRHIIRIRDKTRTRPTKA